MYYQRMVFFRQGIFSSSSVIITVYSKHFLVFSLINQFLVFKMQKAEHILHFSLLFFLWKKRGEGGSFGQVSFRKKKRVFSQERSTSRKLTCLNSRKKFKKSYFQLFPKAEIFKMFKKNCKNRKLFIL